MREHAWPVVSATAAFWASRAVAETTTNTDNYTIKNCVGPDEASGIVSDEAYTNAIAGATLMFALEAGKILNAAVGENWTTIASKMYVTTPPTPLHFVFG